MNQDNRGGGGGGGRNEKSQGLKRTFGVPKQGGKMQILSEIVTCPKKKKNWDYFPFPLTSFEAKV